MDWFMNPIEVPQGVYWLLLIGVVLNAFGRGK